MEVAAKAGLTVYIYIYKGQWQIGDNPFKLSSEI